MIPPTRCRISKLVEILHVDPTMVFIAFQKNVLAFVFGGTVAKFAVLRLLLLLGLLPRDELDS